MNDSKQFKRTANLTLQYKKTVLPILCWTWVITGVAVRGAGVFIGGSGLEGGAGGDIGKGMFGRGRASGSKGGGKAGSGRGIGVSGPNAKYKNVKSEKDIIHYC